MQRYAIIGSGAAGWAAAEAIRHRDRSGAIWILTGDPHGYYSRPGLAYYLTGEVAESQLHPFKQDFWNDLNVHWHIEPVTAVSPLKRLIHFKSGKTLPYDRLLLATGS